MAKKRKRKPAPRFKPRDKVDVAVRRFAVADLRNFLNRVAEILYWDNDTKRWDNDKQWSSDTLDEIAGVFPNEITEAVQAESIPESEA